MLLNLALINVNTLSQKKVNCDSPVDRTGLSVGTNAKTDGSLVILLVLLGTCRVFTIIMQNSICRHIFWGYMRIDIPSLWFSDIWGKLFLAFNIQISIFGVCCCNDFDLKYKMETAKRKRNILEPKGENMNRKYMLFVFFLVFGLPSLAISQDKLKIAIIPKSNTAIYWKSVHTGAKLGAIALSGVEVIWTSPTEENNIAQQISLVDECISKGVSGIVIAPLDNALEAPVARAVKSKIPVVIFDSAIKGKPGTDFVSFVGINNKRAGTLAGEEMARELKGAGKIVLLRYKSDGQSNLSDREEGFLEALQKQKGMRVIEKGRFVSGTVEEATQECMKMANKLQEADGVFCSYEQSTLGMLAALKKLKLSGKVIFIGFDTPTEAVDALKKGDISALVAQDPAQIGFHSLKAMVDYLRGKTVLPKIDVPVRVITQKNINEPEMQKLLALPSMDD